MSRKQDFAVGFMKNSSEVIVRSSADIEDVWQYALKDDLWCHGITALKRKNEASGSSFLVLGSLCCSQSSFLLSTSFTMCLIRLVNVLVFRVSECVDI